MMTDRDECLVLFDGVCNLCSGYVQFIIKRDPGRRFRFASLQSTIGRRLGAEHGFNGLDSMILMIGDTPYRRSGAALRILGRLGGLWQLALIFMVVPFPIRDWAYDLIGDRRYRWFGMKEECWVPGGDISDRFVDRDE